jgi:ATP-binding cassette subfamily B protein
MTRRGTIRISGTISEHPAKRAAYEVRRRVPNDILFADTIASNIAFGRELAMERIEAAAGCAQAREFIDSLPDGYRHLLTTKSSNLSGGQKQRILIARALAHSLKS